MRRRCHWPGAEGKARAGLSTVTCTTLGERLLVAVTLPAATTPSSPPRAMFSVNTTANGTTRGMTELMPEFTKCK